MTAPPSPPLPAPAASFYSPQLDGLRFIAAMLVIVHHSPPVPYLDWLKVNGWVGVDLFLCISAFLITRLIRLEHQKTGTLRIGAFFIRRALRIWPLYLSYATALCLLAVLVFHQPPMQTFAWWMSHLSFTNNVLTAAQGYTPVPFTAHLWTISLEEQAYLIIPFLLFAFAMAGSRMRHLAIFLIGALAILVGSRLALWLMETPHPFIWVLPLRADAFVLGAAGAIVTEKWALPRPTLMLALGAALVASIGLWPPMDQNSPYHVLGYTITAAGCCLVVLASQGDRLSRPLLASLPFRYLGKISYGLYVYHLVAIALVLKGAARAGVDNPLLILAAIAAATIAMSALSYAILEKPFLRLKARFALVASRPI